MASADGRRTKVIVAALLALWLVSTTGGLLAPALIGDQVFLLALLNPLSASVAAAAVQIPLWLFLPACLARLSLGDPLHFALGRLHGRRGLAWLPTRFPSLAVGFERAERSVRRIGLPLTGLVPTGTVMAAAGAVGIRFTPAMTLNLIGTLARLVALWTVGRAAPELVLGIGAATALVLPAAVFLGGCATAARWQRRRTAGAARRRHPTFGASKVAVAG